MNRYNIQTLVDIVTNFGKVTVNGGYESGDMVIGLAFENGDKLPEPLEDVSYNLVWWNSTDYPDPSDDPYREIVRVTAKSGDTLWIDRAQEGTTNTDKNIAGKTYKMILTPTAKTIADLQSYAQTIVETHRTTDIHTLPQPATISLNIWGDGVDGDVTISSDTALTNNMNYNNLTINPGISLRTAGYIVRVLNTLTVNGIIHNDGNSGGGYGSPGAGLADAVLKGSGGGGGGSVAGFPGVAGTSTIGFGGNGGNAGSGGSGGGGGGTCTQNKTITLVELGHLSSLSGRIMGGAGGGGGGSNCSSYPNLGGGGGGGGGAMLIFARTVQINVGGEIRARGGTGGNSTCYAGEGGGGGGGGGGYIYFAYSSLTNNGTISAPGGAGGAQTNNCPPFCGGGAGASGQAGQVVLMQV